MNPIEIAARDLLVGRPIKVESSEMIGPIVERVVRDGVCVIEFRDDLPLETYGANRALRECLGVDGGEHDDFLAFFAKNPAVKVLVLVFYGTADAWFLGRLEADRQHFGSRIGILFTEAIPKEARLRSRARHVTWQST